LNFFCHLKRNSLIREDFRGETMASNGNGLAVLKEIHKIRLDKIEEIYCDEYNEKKKKAEAEIENNPEAKKLEKQQGDLEKDVKKTSDKIEQIRKAIYHKQNLPSDNWDYKRQLISEENARYEKELRSLLNQNDQTKDKHA